VFDGPVPANRDLYWRGLVYSRFAEGTWSVAGSLPDWQESQRPRLAGGREIRYQVLLEPTLTDWLYALETPVLDAAGQGSGIRLTRDYRIEAANPVMSVFRYRLAAQPQLGMDAQPVLSEALRARETRLPDHDNPRIRSYARQLWQRHGGEPARFVDAVLREIREEQARPFFYTLRPPPLPDRNSIDRFWFDTRRGFCTHYAGALVFMLRAVGVPARLVGGYQGGEVNPVTGHLMVRQYDAHAWVEYWLPQRGWIRVDPTAAVAPARIEQGLDAALSQEDRASLSALTSTRFDGSALLRDLLYWADSLEHRWNMWVIGYDGRLQADVLTDLLGEITPARVALAVLAGGAASVGLVALGLFWRRRPRRRHPGERLFAAFCRGVARAGWNRAPAEPPGAFLRRISAAGALPAEQAESLVAELEAVLYNPAASWSRRELRGLQSRLRRLQFRLVLSSVR
jgi:transglutaminase-like putative cysteine protease